ncbi:MAG: phospholipid-binding protein MlaC [Alphaproteobacteria bacterium]
MRIKVLTLTTSCIFMAGSAINANAAALNSPVSDYNSKAASSVIAVNNALDDRAQDFIIAMAQRGIDFLANPELSLEQRKAEFKQLLQENFDIKTLARFSLGRYWNMATEEQKKEYLRLFEKNVIEVYSKRFGDYEGQEFKVISARADGRADAIVRSTIYAENQTISIDWRVREKNGKLNVIDIIVEGVSMATTQRSEFASIIQRGGGNVEALLVHLRQ